MSYLCWNFIVPVLVWYCKDNAGCKSPFACKEEREQTLNHFRIWGNPEEAARLRDGRRIHISKLRKGFVTQTDYLLCCQPIVSARNNEIQYQDKQRRLLINCYYLCVTSGIFSCEFGLSGLITGFAKCYLSSFHYFFLRVFSSHSRTFHSFGDVIITDEGQQILTYTLQSWPLKSEGF